eukprot:gene35950-48362_t
MEGQGTYVWQTGEVYMGQYRNNVRHGKGRMTYADGSDDRKVLITNPNKGELEHKDREE